MANIEAQIDGDPLSFLLDYLFDLSNDYVRDAPMGESGKQLHAALSEAVEALDHRENIRRSVCHALVLHDAKRHLMVCQVCGGTGLGGASVVHERDCALGNLTDTWPGDNVLRQPQQKGLDR
jgi:hypothetical protein